MVANAIELQSTPNTLLLSILRPYLNYVFEGFDLNTIETRTAFKDLLGYRKNCATNPTVILKNVQLDDKQPLTIPPYPGWVELQLIPKGGWAYTFANFIDASQTESRVTERNGAMSKTLQQIATNAFSDLEEQNLWQIENATAQIYLAELLSIYSRAISRNYFNDPQDELFTQFHQTAYRVWSSAPQGRIDEELRHKYERYHGYPFAFPLQRRILLDSLKDPFNE